MRQVMVLGALALGCLASAPAPAATPWWFSLGFNGSRVNNSEGNCGGGQGALSYGGKLMLKLQYSHVSFEDEDHSDGSCDLGYWGDSSVSEPALLVGVIGRSGAFAAVGPARVDFGDRSIYDDPDTPRGIDTGVRFELGWSSRRQSYRPVGLELVLFQTSNSIQSYAGLGINVTFGPRRRISARPLPAR